MLGWFNIPFEQTSQERQENLHYIGLGMFRGMFKSS